MALSESSKNLSNYGRQRNAQRKQPSRQRPAPPLALQINLLAPKTPGAPERAKIEAGFQEWQLFSNARRGTKHLQADGQVSKSHHTQQPQCRRRRNVSSAPETKGLVNSLPCVRPETHRKKEPFAAGLNIFWIQFSN